MITTLGTIPISTAAGLVWGTVMDFLVWSWPLTAVIGGVGLIAHLVRIAR